MPEYPQVQSFNDYESYADRLAARLVRLKSGDSLTIHMRPHAVRVAAMRRAREQGARFHASLDGDKVTLFRM